MKCSDDKNKIKMICQACGSSWDDIKAWNPRCALHGGPVCMKCCCACEYRKGMSGIQNCTFKDPLLSHAEAMKRIKNRVNEENVKATDAFIKKRKEAARKAAIKRAQQKKRRSK